MNIPIRQNLVPVNLYPYKCPYSMSATRLVIHNTANDASAWNEVTYMRTSKNANGTYKKTSFHYAVDDKEIVQGVLESRNAYHAGDGGGTGNRKGLSIEICYSKSGGARWEKAKDNAAQFAAYLLKQRGWGIDKVTKHQDYSGKYCPHRILDEGWDKFLNLISYYLSTDTEMVQLKKRLQLTATTFVKAGVYKDPTSKSQLLGNLEKGMHVICNGKVARGEEIDGNNTWYYLIGQSDGHGNLTNKFEGWTSGSKIIEDGTPSLLIKITELNTQIKSQEKIIIELRGNQAVLETKLSDAEEKVNDITKQCKELRETLEAQILELQNRLDQCEANIPSVPCWRQIGDKIMDFINSILGKNKK